MLELLVIRSLRRGLLGLSSLLSYEVRLLLSSSQGRELRLKLLGLFWCFFVTGALAIRMDMLDWTLYDTFQPRLSVPDRARTARSQGF